MAIPFLSKGVNSWLLSTTVVGSFVLSANVGIVVPVTLIPIVKIPKDKINLFVYHLEIKNKKTFS